MVLRTASARERNAVFPAPGRMMTNSSPPARQAMSSSRTQDANSSAIPLKARSPTSWPRVSLTRLKWSTSIAMTPTVPPMRRARSTSRCRPSSSWRRLYRPVSGSRIACKFSSCWHLTCPPRMQIRSRRFGCSCLGPKQLDILRILGRQVMCQLELNLQAMRDPLTGLYNRRQLEEGLHREVLRARRVGGTVGVMAIDVDHFKRVNDTLGHEVGDRALRGIADELASCVREEDIACRAGGEEFVIILPGAGKTAL